MEEHNEAGRPRIEEEIKNALSRICSLAHARSNLGPSDKRPIYGVLFRVASVGLALAQGGKEHPVIRSSVVTELRAAIRELESEPQATAASTAR